MAIVSDRKMIYERKIAELQTQLTQVSPGSGVRRPPPPLRRGADFCANLFQDEPMDTDQSSTFLSSIQSEIAKYQLLIEEENQKLKRYKVTLRLLWGVCWDHTHLPPSPPARFSSLADRKHSAEAQLPSFHHGAAEDAGGASAADPVGGEGISAFISTFTSYTWIYSSFFLSLGFFSYQAKEKQSAKKAQEAKWRGGACPASCSHASITEPHTHSPLCHIHGGEHGGSAAAPAAPQY